MANLGESDHHVVIVRPKYFPIFRHIKPKTLLVKTGQLKPLSDCKVLDDGGKEDSSWGAQLPPPDDCRNPGDTQPC